MIPPHFLLPGGVPRVALRVQSSRHVLPLQICRNASLSHRKSPSRMILSPSVATPRNASPTPAKKPPSRSAGPFGAMNRRDVPRNIVAQEALKVERRRFARPRQSSAAAAKAPVRTQRDGFKHLKMQKALADVTYGERSQIKKKIDEISNFHTFGLLPSVEEAVTADLLPGLAEIAPTPVQKVAIPALTKPYLSNGEPRLKEFLIAAETGSGKTLAYLLPSINAVKLQEISEKEIKSFAHHQRLQDHPNELESPALSTAEADETGRPKVIVLVPTSELVAQVGRVAKSLAHKSKIRVAMISSAYSTKVIRNRLFAEQGVDLLVSTPHLIKSIADNEPNVLSKVTHLILDEADSLLDRSFIELTQAVIDRCRPSLRKLVFCSATIPTSMDKFLVNRFPETQRLVTPNLHAIPRRVQLGVVDIDKPIYHGNRNLACADTLMSISNQVADPDAAEGESSRSKSVIVFVNERAVADEVAEYLRSKGFMALAFNRDTRPEEHGSVLEPFISRDFQATADSEPVKENAKEGETTRRLVRNLQVLVTTDLGSRGIDTVAVKDVILYDVPHTTIDFIHRLGRTGRMNRRGKGYVLVGKKDRKDIVKEVRDGMFRGAALI